MGKIKNILDWVRDNKRVLVFLFLIITCVYGIWMIFGRLFILAVCLYIAYYVYAHRGELANTRLEDWINPIKWGSVLFAFFMEMMFPMHIVEQLILRMYDNECNKCMQNGSCLHCGCDMSKVFVPWEVCSRGFWWKMVESAKEYKKIRKEWPVIIDIKYPRQPAASPEPNTAQK